VSKEKAAGMSECTAAAAEEEEEEEGERVRDEAAACAWMKDFAVFALSGAIDWCNGGLQWWAATQSSCLTMS
jgi:hypothetical protein